MNRLGFLVSMFLACGGVVDPTDDGGTNDAGTADSAKSDSNISFTCGATTCSGSDAVCVQPCCGGPVGICAPLEDGGACPVGTHLSQQCPSENPCSPEPCNPPPPYCDVKANCPMVQGHDCLLLCE